MGATSVVFSNNMFSDKNYHLTACLCRATGKVVQLMNVLKNSMKIVSV